MGSRRGFRVVLDRKNRQFPMPNAFYGAIIEVTVRHHQLGRSWDPISALFPPDREPMVLARDQDLARGGVLHGVISAPVPIWQLDRLPAKGQAHDLVSQAD